MALLLALSRTGTPAVCAVAMSPWIDFSCPGETMATRVDGDPLLSHDTLAAAARLYLADADPRGNPLAGDFTFAPPVRLQVFEDERGVLHLRFYALLGLRGQEPGTPEGKAEQASMDGENGYRRALLSTLKRTREMVVAGDIA